MKTLTTALLVLMATTAAFGCEDMAKKRNKMIDEAFTTSGDVPIPKRPQLEMPPKQFWKDDPLLKEYLEERGLEKQPMYGTPEFGELLMWLEKQRERGRRLKT